MYLLILDSLGSTELFFILIMALIFFGPRKLPQISRSLGKSLAEFRKASEDFKRTWEREVALESATSEETEINKLPSEATSIWGAQARQSYADDSLGNQAVLSEAETASPGDGQTESLNKRDWL